MQSDTWRIHHTLYSRYIQQFQQREVAKELGLSLRQMRRQDNLAVRALSEFLWNQYDLGNQPVPGVPTSSVSLAGNDRWEEEILWLEKSQTKSVVLINELIQDLLNTGQPLARAYQVLCNYQPAVLSPTLVISPTILRQALLAILTAVIPTIPGGQVNIGVFVDPQRLGITIQQVPAEPSGFSANSDQNENLEIARRLVELTGGNLEYTTLPGGQFFNQVSVMFPTRTNQTVLVIDDNIDTLQLFKRYLTHLGYTFIGSPDPEEAIALAEKNAPCLILLDVMLPGLDGWELLARLREHPRVRGIPIVVSTILPQEQLALALGAAAFVRKPVSQADLLAMLDRLTGPGSPKSG
jgi:CheY-like chemotaxis protein